MRYKVAITALVVVLTCVMHPAVAFAETVETGFLNRSINLGGVEYRYQVYVPRDFQRSRLWPVIVVLHGGGDYGSDGIHQTSIGMAYAIRQHADRFPVIVVFPQSLADGTPGWQGKGGEVALAELDQTLAEFNGDRSRVCLTGFSAGGNGAWYIASRHPERFAALVVVSGHITERRGTTSGVFYPSIAPTAAPDPYAAIAKMVSSLPVWIVHGDADRTISVEESRRMFAALKSLGAEVRYTEILGAGHLDGIAAAYDNAEVVKWMLQQKRPVSRIEP